MPKFKNNDILFAKITPCTENGKIALIQGCTSPIGFGSTEFITISPSEETDPYFLYLLLTSHHVHRKAVALMEGSTGRQRVPAKIFRQSVRVALPPLPEQQEISRQLKMPETNISIKLKKIQKLEKLKKSLMQQLLTGQRRLNF